ncbi:hypothetical protein Syun_003680 [Stephania yunnanensis]|uniref:Pentatricopeptide repeat-containing protein n=1 Tax=Stephania yunnanensis TaxID=152371 RepID=A0AAP0L1L8_9MAGN
MHFLRRNNLHQRIPLTLQLYSLSSLSSIDQTTNVVYDHLHYFLSNPITNIKPLLQSHAIIITTGHSNNNIFLAAKLISSYSSFNQHQFSTHVFNAVNPKDTFLWNSIIKSHFSNAAFSQAFQIYLQMRRLSNALPNQFTLPMVSASCAELFALKDGRAAHVVAFKLGLFQGNSAVASSFVYMYSKCGEVVDASRVFDEMHVRDVVAWTALIIGYVQNGESEKSWDCFCDMRRSCKPNFRTVEGGLQACGIMGDMLKGRSLHGYAVKTGNDSSQFVQWSLLSMYSKHGTAEDAYLAFRGMPNKDLISWTALIGAYSRSNRIHECLELFWEMLALGVEPDGIIISCLVSYFGDAGLVYDCKAFHGVIIRRNFEFDQTVVGTLLSMYCKLGCMSLAEELFDTICERHVESWEIMVFWYSKLELGVKCVEVLREMQHLNVRPTACSLVSAICSCSQLMALRLGRSIHCYVIRSGMDENISIVNSLLGMYARCGNLTIARKLFRKADRDIVTWNTLISACTNNRHHKESLELFDLMVQANLQPNKVTLLTVLAACSHIGVLDHGRRVHSLIKEIGLVSDLSVATALVNMYVKCGQLGVAREIFDSIVEKDVILWNVMIAGYGNHGDATSALEVFLQMENSGVKPTEVSFLAVLLACAHAGLVAEGKYHFDRMRSNYCILPTLKHYACMVDLLGRAGNLQEAESMVLSMTIPPDGGVWGALLGACQIHNDFQMGEMVARRAIESDPENDGYYVILSNIYSSWGKWEEAKKVREMMKNRGVKKLAGWSAV